MVPCSADHRTGIGVGGVVRTDAGVLLVRPTYSRHRGKFLFPGGKVELGESLEAALVREVREEAGINGPPTESLPCGTAWAPTSSTRTWSSSMDHRGGEPTPTSSEADAVGIFDIEDFRQRSRMFPGMVPEIAVPVLEGRHTLLAPNPFEPGEPGYDREAFRSLRPHG